MVGLLKSGPFWIAVITIFALLIGVFIPDFTLDVQTAAGMAVVAAVYFIAYAKSPTGDSFLAMVGSRKFWAAVIGFLVLILNAFHVFPETLDVVKVSEFVAIISIYIFCVAIDPGQGWRKLFVSRKFWAAVVGLGLVMLQAFQIALPAGITDESILGLVVLIMGAIGNFGAQGSVPELPDGIPNDN